MYNYISMELLKVRHARLQRTLIFGGLLAALFTVIWFVGSNSVLPSTMLATVQNNFSTIWIFVLTFALVYEKIVQERQAGDGFHVRTSILNIYKYAHALTITLYWMFFKTLIIYEVVSYALLYLLFGPLTSGFGYVKLILIPVIFIMIYAFWMIPLVFMSIHVAGVLIAGLLQISFGILSVMLPTLYSPWSLFSSTIANISGVSRNGMPTNEYDSMLWIFCLLVFTVFILIYEIVLKFLDNRNR
ncbi:hypothetical protein [Weissella sp. MSCH1]|uniref:hypothetical protein n=1 Tax=Weissella sp. MSCH1 TaxID=3383343 RepID=UPI00389687E6